ncbi:MAG TPA: hypothetical protein VEA38_00890 [Terriglobales bacterium]|nr:hypothetical protein [Terriglobales bacterium]
MGNMSVGNIGSLIGGIGTATAAGAGIASSIQGKEAAERAARLQGRAIDQTTALGGQATALGLAQLDLQRQIAERQIEFANQYLSETQPFRDRILGTAATPVPTLSPLTVGGGGTFAGMPADVVRRLAAGGGIESLPSIEQQAVQAFLAGRPDAGTGGVTLPTRTFSPTNFSVSPAERDAIEGQARVARQNALARGVRGGELNANLLNIDMGRAGLVTGLESAVARRNQELANAAALTNFQAQLEADRFNATDAINVRNMNFADQVAVRNANAANQLQTALFDRNLAAQVGFNAPGTAIPALSSAQAAFNPAAAGAIFNPAMAAQSNAAGVFGQNFASANQQAGGGGAALGSLAAAGKLANSKNRGSSGQSSQTLGQFFGKS